MRVSMRRVECASHITPVARSCSVAGLPALRRLLAQRMTALAPQSSNRAPSATRADGTSKTIISQILAIILAIVLRTKFRHASFSNFVNKRKSFVLVKERSTDGCAATHRSTAYTPHRTARVASSYVMTSDRVSAKAEGEAGLSTGIRSTPPFLLHEHAPCRAARVRDGCAASRSTGGSTEACHSRLLQA